MTLFRTSHWYTPELLRNNPNYYFVFGDNLMRQGLGGQAAIRNEPNAIGLATKARPGTRPDDYFSDNDPGDLALMMFDVSRVLSLSRLYPVVIPFTNRVELGTGLSQLPERAPRLYQILSLIFTEDMPEAILNDPQ